MDGTPAIELVVSRTANLWSGHIPSLGIDISGRSVFTLERRAKEAASAALNCPPGSVTIHRRLKLKGIYKEARETYSAATTAQDEARAARFRTGALVAQRLMDEEGLSLRDAAAVLGMRHSDLTEVFKKAEAIKAS